MDRSAKDEGGSPTALAGDPAAPQAVAVPEQRTAGRRGPVTPSASTASPAAATTAPASTAPVVADPINTTADANSHETIPKAAPISP